jgi:hypothetical protein
LGSHNQLEVIRVKAVSLLFTNEVLKQSVYSITNILALLGQENLPVEWDSHQQKGGTRTVEITLQEGPLQAVQVHGSTREVLTVLSSTR